MTTENSGSFADDILSGARAIGDFIGKTERLAWHLLEGGHIPAFKLGGVWTTTRSRLRQHYNEARYTPPPRDDSEGDAAPPPRRRVGRPRGSTLVRRARSPRSGHGGD